MLVWFYIIMVCYMPLIDSVVPPTNFGPGIPDISFSRLMSYFLVVFFFLQCCIKSSIRVNLKWIGILLVFGAIEIASVSWSNYNYGPQVIQELFNTVFIPFSIAIVAMSIFDDQANIDVFVHNIVISGALLGIISMIQMAVGVHSGFQELRTTGTFNNPNALAVYLVLAIPFVLYGIDRKIIGNHYGLIILAVILGGIVCTISRKGIFTAVLSISIFLLIKKKYKILLTVVVFFGCIAVLLSGIDLISQRFDPTSIEAQTNKKWSFVQAGVKMLMDSPAIGLGYKGYYENFSLYLEDAPHEKFDAHNIFVSVLADYGIIGFIPFMAIFLYPLIVSIKILRHISIKDEHAHLRDHAVLCVTSVIPFMISGWFAGGLLQNTVVILLLYTNISLITSVNFNNRSMPSMPKFKEVMG